MTAAKVLGKLGNKQASDALIKVLADKDENPFVQVLASEVLEELGDKPDIHVLINALADKEPGVRQTAAKALGKLGDKQASAALIKVLADKYENSGVRQTAAGALGKLGDKQASAALLKVLADKHEYFAIRMAAAEAFGNHGGKQASDALGNHGDKQASDALLKVLADKGEYFDFRMAAAEALGNHGDKQASAALLKVLADKEAQPKLRAAAAGALVKIGDKQASDTLINALADKEAGVREATAEVFGLESREKPFLVSDVQRQIHDLVKIHHVLTILSPIYGDNSRKVEQRFYAHMLAGNHAELVTLVILLGEPPDVDAKLKTLAKNFPAALHALQVLGKAWEYSAEKSKIRNDIANKIGKLVKQIDTINWDISHVTLLEGLKNKLETGGYTESVTISDALNELKFYKNIKTALKVLSGQIVFWLVLIILYPRYPMIQAIFFWNPWVRRIIGLGYVGFALTWVPFLRRILFKPFRDNLIVDANIDAFESEGYFDGSEVIIPPQQDRKALNSLLTNLKGQIILEGDSGLGKSMCLKRYLKKSSRIVGYVTANRCDQGVMAAIQDKLQGPAKDEAFLRNLIYIGAIDICVDGVNEVSPDTRANITEFAERYFQGNILIASQPMEWTKPATAKTWVMQPLSREQIKAFLLSRETFLDADANLTGESYRIACEKYLNLVLNERLPIEAIDTNLKILSNPMDLNVVAQIIAQGEAPDIFNLRQQQYQTMAKDYLDKHQQSFPLQKLAEHSYQMRLQDTREIDEEMFGDEINCLARHKLVSIKYKGIDKNEKVWHFRHEKIMDFFIVNAFLNNNSQRQVEHFADSRFRGVYFLLADLLPLEDAQSLREKLIDYAVDQKDHSVCDGFVRIIRDRKINTESKLLHSLSASIDIVPDN